MLVNFRKLFSFFVNRHISEQFSHLGKVIQKHQLDATMVY